MHTPCLSHGTRSLCLDCREKETYMDEEKHNSTKCKQCSVCDPGKLFYSVYVYISLLEVLTQTQPTVKCLYFPPRPTFTFLSTTPKSVVF